MAVLVHLDTAGRKALGELDAFFQRLFHLLVVQRIAWGIYKPATVGDG